MRHTEFSWLAYLVCYLLQNFNSACPDVLNTSYLPEQLGWFFTKDQMNGNVNKWNRVRVDRALSSLLKWHLVCHTTSHLLCWTSRGGGATNSPPHVLYMMGISYPLGTLNSTQSTPSSPVRGWRNKDYIRAWSAWVRVHPVARHNSTGR